MYMYIYLNLLQESTQCTLSRLRGPRWWRQGLSWGWTVTMTTWRRRSPSWTSSGTSMAPRYRWVNWGFITTTHVCQAFNLLLEERHFCWCFYCFALKKKKQDLREKTLQKAEVLDKILSKFNKKKMKFWNFFCVCRFTSGSRAWRRARRWSGRCSNRAWTWATWPTMTPTSGTGPCGWPRLITGSPGHTSARSPASWTRTFSRRRS